MPPSHVLVPFDGSPLADEALKLALEIFDCQVTVLDVVTPVDAKMSEGRILEPDTKERESVQDRITEVVTRVGPESSASDQTVETAVETGDPAETILEYIDDHDVDHVVMGSHGSERSDIARRLLGTVATTVVGESPVTVTVVR